MYRGKALIAALSIAFLAGIGLFTPDCSYAGIAIEPTITEITVPADTATKGTFKVTNVGDSSIRVKVEIEDWLKLRLGSSKIPVEKWLTVTPMEFDVGPKGTEEVEYIINIPKGYEGEVAAMVFFSSQVEEAGAFNIMSRFGVSIYAAVQDSIVLACNIKDIKVLKDMEKKEGAEPVDRGVLFVIDIENKGNVHLRPTGTIKIISRDGTEYFVNIGRGFPVYPGKVLSYAIPWPNKDIKPGRYQARVSLDYGNIYNIDKKAEKGTSFLVKKDGTISF